MTAPPTPGPSTPLRRTGIVLTAAGLALFAWGAVSLWAAMDEHDGADLRQVAAFLGGFLLTGVGLRCRWPGPGRRPR